MSVGTIDASVAREKFLKAPFALRHGLSGHRLFTLERLVEFARSLPRDRVGYTSGRLASGRTPQGHPADMTPALIIRRIEMAGAGMTITGLEQDPEYAAILKAVIDDAQAAAGKKHGGYGVLEGSIIVSPAGSATPFCVDAEESILIQIRGDQFVHVFENAGRLLVPEAVLESLPSRHRSQPYQRAYESLAQMFVMKEGDAVHIPYLRPQAMRTGARYSVALVLTWKTQEVRRLNKIRRVNATLRRFGLPQPPPGLFPAKDTVKVIAHNALYALIAPVPKCARKHLGLVLHGRNAGYRYRKARTGA